MSNAGLVQDIYEAFGSGDIPAVLGKFDASIAWREAEGNPYQPSGDAWTGPEAVLENLFVRLGADWDTFTATPRRYHDAGKTVIVEGRYGGTCKATGKELDAQFCHVWKIRDGKVAGFQQYTDTAQLQVVMDPSA